MDAIVIKKIERAYPHLSALCTNARAGIRSAILTLSRNAIAGAYAIDLTPEEWDRLAQLCTPRPPHRPRRDPTAARVVKSYRVHPDTAAKIESEAKHTGESQGQVIDRLVEGLKNA